MLHVATCHPLELLQHPRVAPAVSQLAFQAGQFIAELLRAK